MLIAAVSAKVILVFKKLGLLKHAHHGAQLQHGLNQLASVAACVQVTLGRRVLCKGWGFTQIKHHVECCLGFARLSGKINRSYRVAGCHTVPMGFAARQINLITQVNCAFRADGNTGVATGTHVQVDRVCASPGGLKSTQTSSERHQLPALDFALMLLTNTCQHAASYVPTSYTGWRCQ